MKRIATALGYIDELIWLLVWLVGLAFAVIAATGGASAVEVGLILAVTIAAAIQWALTSNVWDWLRGREP